jgi:hypothetical protein
MQQFKGWFGVLEKSYSCQLGVLINGLILLTFGLITLFPAVPPDWITPIWCIYLLIFVAMLMPVAVVLVIYDLMKQQCKLAMVGAVVCLWPVLYLWVVKN